MTEKLVEILSDFIFKILTEELLRQNHKLTGALIKSFEAQIGKVTQEKITIDFLMFNYGLSLNNGIKPERIPYTIGGPRRGGKSKYIEGLIKFARIKFQADKKRAESIAFAIATKQKKEGYPLTGKIGFIDISLTKAEDEIAKIIEVYFQETINLLFEEFIEFKNVA